MRKLPFVSIVIVTYNNERTIGECIKNILKQDYPKRKIEYLNIDGGSKDKTLEIIRRSPFNIVESPTKRNAEAQRSAGLHKAKHNLIVSIDADNYIYDKNWLKAMVKPFMENKDLVHANTLHYTYKKDTTLFNRYCALFGVLDPIVLYVGRPDRLQIYKKKWVGGKEVKKTKDYIVVEHSLDTLPTVGCNGVVYRKDLLIKYAKSTPKDFLHIDVFADLVEKGFNKFAVVNNDLFHDTSSDLITLLRKRLLFLSNYYLQEKIKRRYLIYNPHLFSDNIKLFLFVLYTLTLVKPFYDSTKGFLKVRDIAWFMHPVICVVFLLSYGIATGRKLLKI